MSVVTTTVLSAGKKIDPTWQLLSVDITREVNRIPRAQLVLLDGDAAKQVFPLSDSAVFEPGKEIEIRLRYEGKKGKPGQDRTVFKGLVIHHQVEAGPGGSQLVVELKDAAIGLTLSRKSEVHREKTDDAIIGDLIKKSKLTKGKIQATQPKHPEIVQYYCADWDFILSRAGVHGLLVVVNDGEVSLRPMTVGGTEKHSFEFGIDEIHDFEMRADAAHQHAEVQGAAWDMKNQKPTAAAKAKAFKLSQGNLQGDRVAKAVGGGDASLTNPVPLDPKELQAWANGIMAASRMSLLRGRIAVPGLADIELLDVMKVAGVGKRFNGKTLVTGIRHRVDGRGWQTDIQFGISADRFCLTPDIRDVPAAGLLPAVNGLQIGVVDKFEEDPDKEFRVKVILPGIDAKKGAVRARLASPDAGKGRGFFFRPEKGDEVVVGFFNDDPRQAVILGSLFGSRNAPPEDLSKLTEENTDKGLVAKEGAMLKFGDGDKKSGIVVETPGSDGKPIGLYLNDREKKHAIRLEDQYGNCIVMGERGISIVTEKKLEVRNKDKKGYLYVMSSGDVEIKGSKVDVK
uniref:Rhs element Vgr protein n=1 Tax=Candidatus Kentrum sp. SD TaxID=2126332 RepID=A0A451BHQ3_9GAMM|nr:MAG: Rhs element Vgr protein [Candidatus Kentron sp. SD]VFK39174.1 MAG: Rhs element Vgr protein [Candidatus Kentron sp. SD]VFK77814.1 MAG: Rhs element Vgr protein [Candidatus Kentron sp. SD]